MGGERISRGRMEEWSEMVGIVLNDKKRDVTMDCTA